MPGLSVEKIKGFAHAGGWDVRWDGGKRGVTGLGLRIYPSGKKAFVLSYRIQGRKRLMRLGRFGVLTLDEARKKANKHLGEVDDGIDPLERRKQQTRAGTFGELREDYIEKYAKKHKRTWETDEGRLTRHIPPSWENRKARAISHEDIENLHIKIGRDRPYEANRTLDLLRVVFRVGKDWSAYELKDTNPAVGIGKYPEKSRKRWVNPEEVKRLAEAIDGETNIYVRAAIWLYLLTGVRKNELLGINRDEDIDWNRRILTLPKTKAGEEQYVALSAPAVAIMQALPALSKNPYLLPGAKSGRHLVNIDKPWRRIRKVAGLEDVHIHDLRRTLGSWMSQEGVDLNRIKGALRHANVSTTLTYARLGEDPVREAMEQHGERILEAAGRKGPRGVAVMEANRSG
jgi:integrase